MIRPSHLIGATVLAGAVTAPGCMTAAYAANNCGGNSTPHPAPIDCTNTLTVGGITGGARLQVTTSGAVHVDAQVSNKNVALYLQVKAHEGISSSNGFNGATAVFVNGVASVDLTMPGCLSQVDTKIVPGTPTLDHVPAVYRVAAPLVELPNCGTPTTTTTTVTTTVPQSSTTSVPPQSSTVPPAAVTTTPGPVQPVETTVPTTAGGTLPPTGSSATPVAIGLGLLIGGLLLLTAAVRRRAS